ncbi:MAG: hypothetical protein K2X81_09900, partial [Candidatus Obscuribacterales bacterium]|nr:hypothetical protein [Candidatus Obscuribacterales bacterium]
MDNNPDLQTKLETQNVERDVLLREASEPVLHRYDEQVDSPISVAKDNQAVISNVADNLPLPKFPNIFLGVLSASFFTLIINFFPFELNQVHKMWLLHLPMQLLWTSCLYRLVQTADR